MSRKTAKMSAAALLAVGTLLTLPTIGRAQDQAAPKPPEAPAAAAPAVAPEATAPAPAAAPTAAAPAPAATPTPAEPPAAAAAAPAPAAPPAAAAPAPAAPPAAAAPAPATPPAAAAPAPAAPPAAAAPATPEPKAAEAPPPEEVDLPLRPVLSVSGQGKWAEAEDKLGSAFETLAIAAKKAGVKPAGAPLVQYTESDDAGFSFVVMLPVDKAAKAAKLPKGVKADVSPAGLALRFSPSSTADDLEEVYARIDDYIASAGLTLGTVIEEYGEDAIASPEDRVVVDIYVFAE